MRKITAFLWLWTGLSVMHSLRGQEPVVRPVETYLNLDAEFGQYREQGQEKFFDSVAFPVLEKYNMLMSEAWYDYQAKVWERDLKKGVAGEEGWLYMFRALRLAGRPQAADSLKKALEIYQPASWAAKAVRWYALGPGQRPLREFPALFQQSPNTARPFLIPELLQVLDALCDTRRRDSLLQAWQNSEEWPKELVYYGYNLAQTPVENAVLFTDGPFETAAVLQVQHLGVRPDVKVINLFYLGHPEYRNCVAIRYNLNIPFTAHLDPGSVIRHVVTHNPSRAFYISQSTTKTIFRSLGLPLYCEGLAYRIGKPSYSTFYRLLDNVENNYNLKYLEDSLSKNTFNKFRAAQFNTVYVAPLLQVFDLYYYKEDFHRAEYWYQKALRIARQSGNEDLVRMHRLFWERKEEKPSRR
ncbi:MAG: hypothetical protein N2110_09070 [Flavobacteriales bacterium]|nr:hypothetical protein [Flavobacteriales bacterium]MCX7769153.1 hypothetical protein [Flavobacteriales bacterium]MDW8410768.1 hypothetical protein [Flavobacteriales bacterium]